MYQEGFHHSNLSWTVVHIANKICKLVPLPSCESMSDRDQAVWSQHLGRIAVSSWGLPWWIRLRFLLRWDFVHSWTWKSNVDPTWQQSSAHSIQIIPVFLQLLGWRMFLLIVHILLDWFWNHLISWICRCLSRQIVFHQKFNWQSVRIFNFKDVHIWDEMLWMCRHHTHPDVRRRALVHVHAPQHYPHISSVGTPHRF